MSSVSLESVKIIEVDENDFMVDKYLQKVAMAGWVRSLMKTDGNCSSPLNIDPKSAETISLPPLEWYNYDEKAKIMKIKNTGNTVLLKGEWEKERPFLTGGPLRGCYVFSQAHFHWGPTNKEGSEHSFMGERFVMEMHAVFFKAIYRTQSNALLNRDGIANLAYFFELDEVGNHHLRPILQLIPEIYKPKSTQEIQPLSLADLGIKDFKNEYYFYYGSTDVEERAFPVMWFIRPIPSPISSSQVDLFRNILSSSGGHVRGNFKSPVEKGRNIFYIYDESEDVQSEKEVRSITADEESGKVTEPVVSKTLTPKRKGPLKSFLSFFSKTKKHDNPKRKWRLFRCFKRTKKRGDKLQVGDRLNPRECEDEGSGKTKKIKGGDKEIEGSRSKSEGSLKEEGENRGDTEEQIITPVPSKEEFIEITSADLHTVTTYEKVADAVEKKTSKVGIEYNDDENETSKYRNSVRIDTEVRIITNDLETHSEKSQKGVYVDVHELSNKDKIEEDETKKAIEVTVRSSVKVNAHNLNETNRTQIIVEERKENEMHGSVCEACNESKMENSLWIEEHHSKEEVSWRGCETNEGGSKRESAAAEKAGGDEDLKNSQNRFPEKIMDVLKTQIDSNFDEHFGVKTAMRKVKVYHAARRPSKKVPDLRKILEMCKSNPDELLCVTACIRDPRKIEMKRRQVQRKYFSLRHSKVHSRVSHVSWTSDQEKMPIIPEEV